MNRDIKFRGKSLTGDKWVYGSLITYSKPETTPDIYDPETMQYIAVDPETVGQYIDLKDENDADIYENDVVIHTYYEDEKEKYVICWNEQQAGFGFAQNRENSWPVPLCQLLDNNSSLNFEIVGTIHDRKAAA